MYSLDGPRKNAIDALQEEIDINLGEINQLRSAHNSHIPISGLPAELLSEVFFLVIESGLRNDDTTFATGTFGFRRACKHWNEVAVSSPQLWLRWPSGAAKAWHLFNARSKDAPIFLTLRPQLHGSIRDTLMSPTVPRRIRQLDFSGDHEQSVHLLGALDPPSNASSIRLHITPYQGYGKRSQGHLTRFLSSPFQKLSKLDLKNFLPDFSSPIFTTSNLVSLKLEIPHTSAGRYTGFQFSQILQRHPNLQELDLKEGAMPRIEKSGAAPVPVVLPQLVNLILDGVDPVIARFMDHISMSSPLHNVDIRFQHTTYPSTAFYSTIKEIVTSYYACQGPVYPRTPDHLTISGLGRSLVFNAQSHPSSISYPTSNLKIQLDSVHGLERTCLSFPLDHVREFTASGFRCSMGIYHRILEKMEGLLHLRLYNLDIEPVLDVLSFDEQFDGAHEKAMETTLDILHAYR